MACGLLDWYMLTWLCKGCCSRTQARNEGEGRGDRKIEERKDTSRNRIKGTNYAVVSERSPTLFLMKEFKDAGFFFLDSIIISRQKMGFSFLLQIYIERV